jgi:hypothetical protein
MRLMIREFCTQSIGRRICKTKSELLYYINKYNGKDEVYISVYRFKREPLTFDNAIIDKIFIDLDPFDNTKNLIEDFHRLHEYLDSENTLHSILFSGGGFHFYIRVKNCWSKTGLYKSTKDIIEKSGIGRAVDESTIGDYRQVARVPFTWNVKRQRYCVPVCEIKDYDYYREISKPENIIKNGTVVFGKKLFNVDEFNSFDGYVCDFDVNIPDAISVNKEDLNTILSSYGYRLEDFNDYTQRFLSKKDMNYYERSQLMIFFKNKVFKPKRSPELIEYDLNNMLLLLRAVLNNDKFKHCLESKQLRYIFKYNYKLKNKKLGFKI